MIIELRHREKAPTHENVERILVKYGESTYEIYASPNTDGDGIRIALREPIHMRLAVAPHAGNVVDLHCHRFDRDGNRGT